MAPGSRRGRALGRALLVAAAAVGPVAVAGATPSVIATSPAGASLVVTFREAPAEGAVRASLAGLGPVTPVAPEAGVWSITAPADPALRDRVLARTGVTSAEWALRRSSDDIVPPTPAPPQPLSPVATPTDTYFANLQQWAMLPGPTTWGADLMGTPARPRIAILDSGVDTTHEEWAGPNSPLVRPWSAWTGAAQAEDWGRTGHGTHVAGTAAAPANGLGIVGTAPGAAGVAEVVPIQISDRDGFSTDVTMMKGIRWAVRQGAKVINISAGGSGDSVAFQRVIDWAFSAGALVVASVGNDGQGYGVMNYPAGYAHVLGVAAQCSARTDAVDCPTPYGLALFSNRNASVDIVAPGVDIISSVPLRITTNRVAPGYAIKEGTSMAAPFVAGVAALVFAANPGATPYQVMRQLQNSATDIGPRGRDLSTGSGVVNPRAALTLPLPPDDPGESNDDAIEVRSTGAVEASLPPTLIRAAIDRDNDPRDVYPVILQRGQTVRLVARATGAKVRLALWAPGTRSVTSRGARPAAASRGGSARPRLRYVATRSGRWLVSVSATGGRGSYSLEVGR